MATKLPLPLLILDFAGMLLLSLGIFEQFADSDSLLPEIMQEPAMPWVLIGSGLLLMMPVVLHLVRQIRSRH